MGHAEFRGNGFEARIGGPQTNAGHESGGQQVDINPANTAAIQFPMAHELDYLGVWHGRRAMNLIVNGEELPPAPAVADEQLARYQFVCRNIVERQQPAEFLSVRGPVRQKANPDRCIDQDHLCRWQCCFRVLTTPGHVFGFGFAASKTPKAVIGCATDERFEAEPHSFGVRQSATSCFRGSEELFVDVQRLLHRFSMPYVVSAWIWQFYTSFRHVRLSGAEPLYVGPLRIKYPRYGASVFTAPQDTAIIRGFRDLRRRQVFA